eukprot:TRINITY_DN50230_c0_g1_i1.p1 TRINITY_DN50230_c0_g1~~TRINITY_DN50230_c0_g1_i1.p1  ORF type:complete len:461 (-),score=105.11 TRINITY_DN50230_c0_g1_i1:224-1606(-)
MCIRDRQEKASKYLEETLDGNTQADARVFDACCAGLALCAPDGDTADLVVAKRQSETPSLAICAVGVSARLKTGDFEGALTACMAGVERFPESLELLSARGVCLHGLGKTTEATVQFQDVLAVDRTHKDTLNSYAVLLMQQQYFGHAATIYEQMLARAPMEAHLWNNLAIAYKGCGRIQDALDALAQAVQIGAVVSDQPTSVIVEQTSAGCYSRGYSYARELDPRDCCQRLQVHTGQLHSASQRNPSDVALLEAQGASCRSLSIASEDPRHKQVYKSQARLCFAKSLELAPAGWIPAFQLAMLAADEADYVGAQQFFTRCLQANPGSFGAWNNLGVMLQLTQHTGDAELVLAKALEVAPNSHCTWNNLGNLYRQQGKFIEAQNAYDRCLELKNDYSPAYNNLGLLYVSLGAPFYSNAHTMLEVAHKIDPTLLCAKSNIARLKALEALDHEDADYPDLMHL